MAEGRAQPDKAKTTWALERRPTANTTQALQIAGQRPPRVNTKPLAGALAEVPTGQQFPARTRLHIARVALSSSHAVLVNSVVRV